MHRPTHPAADRCETRQTPGAPLLPHHRTLLNLGSDIATAARLAAAMHMADSAPTAQNPRDQAARLRDLVASLTEARP